MISARNLDYNLARVQFSCRRLVLGIGEARCHSSAAQHKLENRIHEISSAAERHSSAAQRKFEDRIHEISSAAERASMTVHPRLFL